MALGAGGARYRIGGPEGPADTVWPGAYRRGALLGAGGFDERLRRNEDYAMHWRLRELGHTVWFDPDLQVGYRPRETFPALARQYFANGWWKLRMLRRHPRSLRARQLAPPALGLALAASAGLAAFGLHEAAAVAPGAYLAALLGAPAISRRARRDPRAAILLPGVFATMHLAWAGGFWCSALAWFGGSEATRRPAARAARDIVGARGFAEDVLGVILVSAVAVLHAVEPKLIGSIPRERNSYAFTASRAKIPLDELRRDALGLETKRYPCGTRHQHLSRSCNYLRLQLVDISTNNRTKNVSRHSVNGERQPRRRLAACHAERSEPPRHRARLVRARSLTPEQVLWHPLAVRRHYHLYVPFNPRSSPRLRTVQRPDPAVLLTVAEFPASVT